MEPYILQQGLAFDHRGKSTFGSLIAGIGRNSVWKQDENIEEAVDEENEQERF